MGSKTVIRSPFERIATISGSTSAVLNRSRNVPSRVISASLSSFCSSVVSSSPRRYRPIYIPAPVHSCSTHVLHEWYRVSDPATICSLSEFRINHRWVSAGLLPDGPTTLGPCSGQSGIRSQAPPPLADTLPVAAGRPQLSPPCGSAWPHGSAGSNVILYVSRRIGTKERGIPIRRRSIEDWSFSKRREARTATSCRSSQFYSTSSGSSSAIGRSAMSEATRRTIRTSSPHPCSGWSVTTPPATTRPPSYNSSL